MAWLDGVLMGFCVGFASGIFLAYKIAQRGHQRVPAQEIIRDPPGRGRVLDGELEWENKKQLK